MGIMSLTNLSISYWQRMERVEAESNWAKERELERDRNGESHDQLQDRSRQTLCSFDLRFIGLLPLRLSKFQSPLPCRWRFHRSPLLSRHSRPSLPPYECLVSFPFFFLFLLSVFPPNYVLSLNLLLDKQIILFLWILCASRVFTRFENFLEIVLNGWNFDNSRFLFFRNAMLLNLDSPSVCISLSSLWSWIYIIWMLKFKWSVGYQWTLLSGKYRRMLLIVWLLG